MNKPPTFITGNQNKADYLSRYLGFAIDYRKIDLDEIQSASLEDIIQHKVKQAFEITRQPVIVDDISMGLVSLNGLPGPFIKFFVESPDGLRNICRMADGLDSRSARAMCAIGYYDGQNLQIFKSTLDGDIAMEPAGKTGYGWDAVFCPKGYGGRTRAELNEQEYEDVYRLIRPLEALKEFLTSL